MPTPTTSLAALLLVAPALPPGTSVLSVDSSILPFVINGDTDTYRVEIGIYNTTVATNSSTPVALGGTAYNQFTPSVSLVPTVQETNVQIVGRNYDPNATWQPLTAYAAGYRYVDINGYVQEVVTAGTSGASLPSFSSTVGGTTSDGGPTSAGGALWQNVGVTAITPVTKFALIFYQSGLATVIAPPSGISALKDQTDCTVQWVTPDFPGFIGVRVMLSTDPAGINPPYAQFGDLVTKVTSTSPTTISSSSSTAVSVTLANITNVALTNNNLTIDAANTLAPGDVVAIGLSGSEGTDLANATFLNGETLTVETATATQFTANFPFPDYPSTPDTGTAVGIVSTSTSTTVSTVMTTNYSSVDVPFSQVNANTFYAMLSTVIQGQDTATGTNYVFESVQNGPCSAASST